VRLQDQADSARAFARSDICVQRGVQTRGGEWLDEVSALASKPRQFRLRLTRFRTGRRNERLEIRIAAKADGFFLSTV